MDKLLKISVPNEFGSDDIWSLSLIWLNNDVLQINLKSLDKGTKYYGTIRGHEVECENIKRDNSALYSRLLQIISKELGN